MDTTGQSRARSETCLTPTRRRRRRRGYSKLTLCWSERASERGFCRHVYLWAGSRDEVWFICMLRLGKG